MASRSKRAKPDGLTWGVSAAADQLGVAASTLRTWDRRYDVGPAVRTVGGHRRYNADDIARVRRMAELIDGGATPESAARVVLDDEPPVG
ncbi:MerR family transcriptional regulator [Aeromicrobium sp. Leaf350]|uniref:MerR family transcriptional regulator n=1 Tax=Aeromicrobium sp. Leaf350 TaxID=2876565 RepID=UPI001E38E495|nr:MerR family transcriptional regulator [Aeromicrobium sp. Leaf350]